MSAVAIVLIVIGVLALLGFGACAVGLVWLKGRANNIMAGLVDGGGIVLSAPPAVTAELRGPKKNYVGAWRSARGSALDIDSAGNMTFENNESGMKKKLSASIAEFRGDDMVIRIGLSIVIHVTQPPHPVGEHWAMTADGVSLQRE
jgi:hypothetical protein